MSLTGQMDPSTRFVRSLDGQFFMLREAAEMLRVSHRTLRRLIESTKDLPDEEKLGPSFCTYFGKVQIYLYTLADVEKIRAHLMATKVVYRLKGEPSAVGRPRRWTPEQRKERQRLYSRHNYYKKRRGALSAVDDVDGATAADEKLGEVERRLAEMEREIAA